MNEQELYSAIGFIDDDLIAEASVSPDTSKRPKPTVSKRNIYAFGSVAAAAVITVVSVAFYNAHEPSELLLKPPVVDTDTSKNDTQNHNETNLGSVQPLTEYSESSAELTDSSNISDATENNSVPTDTASNNSTGDKDDSPVAQPTEQTNGTTDIPHKDVPPTNSKYYLQEFSATIDPYSDDYGQDELPFVSVIVSGNTYTQLDESEYGNYNVDDSITDADFGEYIGTVAELFEHDDSSKYTVSSKEPNLAGAEVFYYAPADSQSVILVKKGEQCSVFTMNGMAYSWDLNVSPFAQTFKFYGAETFDDIQSISFTIAAPNGGVFEITSQGTITDRNTIDSIADILYQLTPEQTAADSFSATPQWLNEAWDAYRAAPDAYTREDITIEITFQNGAVLKDISYQPYLGNGYVSGMRELTAEQNTTLRDLLNEK